MADRLSERSIIAGAASSGVTGNVKTPVYDMSQGNSILFIAVASASNSSNRLAMRMGTASASAGLSDATGQIAHTVSGVLVYDAYKPTKRFVQGRYSASGATGAAVAIVGIQYGLRQTPSTHPAATLVGRFYSAGSGTASG